MTEAVKIGLPPVALRAARWLAHARTDLARARGAAEADPEIAVFHFQQAAEKALNAVLIAAETPFERTHSLDRLLVRAARIEARFLECPGNPERVSAFASRFRYPGDGNDDMATPEDVAEARLVSEWLVEAAGARLAGPVAETAGRIEAARARRPERS